MGLEGLEYRSTKLTTDRLWKGVANKPTEEDRLGKGFYEWTAAKLLLGAGAGADPTEIDVPAGGGGHITVLPDMYSAIIQGTWSHINDMCAGGGFLRNSTGANADEVNYLVGLAAGTYTLRLLFTKTVAGGIVDVYVDGTEEGSIDTYAAATAFNNVLNIPGIVVAAPAMVVVRVVCDGKHASSTKWQCDLQEYAFWRTA